MSTQIHMHELNGSTKNIRVQLDCYTLKYNSNNFIEHPMSSHGHMDIKQHRKTLSALVMTDNGKLKVSNSIYFDIKKYFIK